MLSHKEAGLLMSFVTLPSNQLTRLTQRTQLIVVDKLTLNSEPNSPSHENYGPILRSFGYFCQMTQSQ